VLSNTPIFLTYETSALTLFDERITYKYIVRFELHNFSFKYLLLLMWVICIWLVLVTAKEKKKGTSNELHFIQLFTFLCKGGSLIYIHVNLPKGPYFILV